jgi:PEGA domain
MKRMILAGFVLMLALFGFPAAANAQSGHGGGHGGGGHGGGGHGGGGHGGGGHWGGGHGGGGHWGGGHGGGGYWGGGHGGRGYWGGGHGGRGYWGGGHGGGGYWGGRGYWGGWRGGYWGGYWGPGWGWGWGVGAGWGWGYPYYAYPGYPYAGYPYGGYAYGAPGPVWAAIDTDVSPDEARVFLDGRYIGIADNFDGFPDYLYLDKGHYRLEFRLDGYETKVVELDARPGTMLDISDKLHKIPGAKQYGSYDTPEPPGGVQRFFGKKGDGSGAVVTPDEQPQAAPDQDEPYGPEDRSMPPATGGSSSSDWRGRQSGSGSVTVRPGASRQATRLTIRAVPADAAVYVDDRFVGTAEQVSAEEQGLRVPPGRHRVTVSRPGYKDQSVEVEVESGQTESVEIELER